MNPRDPVNVFISYSRKDAQIASAVFLALEQFSKLTGYHIKPVWDQGHFHHGTNLNDETISAIERSDVLVLVYTSAGRKSAWVSEEVAIFKFLMARDRKEGKQLCRRIVPIYTDNFPETLDQTLGIKLETAIIARSSAMDQELDPSQGFQQLFKEFLENYPPPDPAHLTNQQLIAIQADRLEAIEEEIVPALLTNLRLAFSDLVSTLSVEQKAITINWPSGLGQVLKLPDVLERASLTAETPDVFHIFGIRQSAPTLEWVDFKSKLYGGYPAEAHFISDSLAEAVKSALEVRPVDNDQFFRGHDNTIYRVIVTRHYSYYNGRRTMNVYFLPVLNPFGENPAFVELGMLTSAIRFKVAFLETNSEVAVDAFRACLDDNEAFRRLAYLFERQLLTIDHLSHAFHLDDREVVRRYFGNSLTASDIAEMFKVWKAWHKKVVDGIRTVHAMAETAPQDDRIKITWIDLLIDYIDYTKTVNRQMGRLAAERLVERFPAP